MKSPQLRVSKLARGLVTDSPQAAQKEIGTKTDNGAPKAYLNWLIFDRNYVSLTGGFKQITTAGKEAGTDVAHELVTSPTINITDAGYVYIWLSNENTTPVEVYFDDFKVTQTKSPVVAMNDYYPFGLKYNAYVRENSLPNTLKLFQGQEHVDDLGLNWDSFKWRNHQPDIGRFFNVDPLAEKYVYNSPYAFSENKVVAHIELEGLESVYNLMSVPGVRAMEQAVKPVLNAPQPEAPPTPPTGGDKVLNGLGNMLMGAVGALGSGAYIIGTEGAGAALGGGVAFSLSLGEMAIGLAQTADGVSEMMGGPSEKSGVLQKSSSLPGITTYVAAPEHGQFADAAGQFIPGIFSGGNLKAIVQAPMTIWKSENATQVVKNTLGGLDAASDTSGLFGAVLQELKRMQEAEKQKEGEEQKTNNQPVKKN